MSDRVPMDLANAAAERSNKLGAIQGYKVTRMAEEDFERGHMLWRGDMQRIYVLHHDGSCQRYQDTWQEGMREYPNSEECEPRTPPTPKRGFGLLWEKRPEVREKIGYAITEECEIEAQMVECNDGLLVKSDSGRIYALYEREGRWEHLDGKK